MDYLPGTKKNSNFTRFNINIRLRDGFDNKVDGKWGQGHTAVKPKSDNESRRDSRMTTGHLQMQKGKKKKKQLKKVFALEKESLMICR